jgi:hypothetical protein
MLINSGGTAESAAESVPTGSGELTPDKPHKSGVRWNKTYEEAPSVKQEHPILHGREDVRTPRSVISSDPDGRAAVAGQQFCTAHILNRICASSAAPGES